MFSLIALLPDSKSASFAAVYQINESIMFFLPITRAPFNFARRGPTFRSHLIKLCIYDATDDWTNEWRGISRKRRDSQIACDGEWKKRGIIVGNDSGRNLECGAGGHNAKRNECGARLQPFDYVIFVSADENVLYINFVERTFVEVWFQFLCSTLLLIFS